MHGNGEQPRVAQIRAWAGELGFSAIGIAAAELGDAPANGLLAWLAAGKQGTMDYMAQHGLKRARPADLVPGTRSVITLRMNYLAAGALDSAAAVLATDDAAYVSRYALGRDYHKVLRTRLKQLAQRMTEAWGKFEFRVFTDSAPVLEVELAQASGMGWRGKHTLLLERDAGSWFFLGEIFTNLALPFDPPVTDHCGTCTACLDSCPTDAFDGAYQLDARRCISYLTIELKEAIPIELRPQLGNRIYGCDDCQLACPWTRFASISTEPDFAVRHQLDALSLIELFAWSVAEFEQRMAGSAIYRIGYERWLRNIAVALGNAKTTDNVVAALKARAADPSALVREHVQWALARHGML